MRVFVYNANLISIRKNGVTMNITTNQNGFENGFDITSDIFNRKTLYDQMIRLIINAPDSNLVLR